MNRTLNQLQRVFLLRSCTDATFASRTRPCLLYQIKRCSAPCVRRISETDYAGLVADAERFLQGRSTSVQLRLAAEMAEASAAMEYERAAALRDRIKALTAVQSVQAINPKGVPEADVVALHLDAGQACVQVFFIRGNQSWGNRDFYPRTGGSESPAEIMQAFLAQFYVDKLPPRLILLSDAVEDADLMARLLSDRAGRRVVLGCRSAGKRPSWWPMHCATPAKAWPAGWRKARPSGGCWKAWPRRSSCRWCRAGSRSTTTATSRAQPRSAA